MFAPRSGRMDRRETSPAFDGSRVGVVAVITVGLLVFHSVSLQALAPTNTIIELRVHGNQSMTSEDVLAVVGLAVGDQIADDDVAGLELRLLESGRFEFVEVRIRYRSFTATDEVVLIVVVRERAGATSTNPVTRLLGPLGRRMLFLPIVDYTEGDGVTYGARMAVVDILGADGRLSVPATWGGWKRIGAEIDRSFEEAATMFQAGGARIRRENPHFEIDDDRTTLWVSTQRQLPLDLRIGGRVEWADVAFGVVDDTVMSYQVSLELDTRRTVSFPRNAVLARVGYEWLDSSSAGSVIGRPEYEVRAYKGLIGQTVLAVRAHFHGADGPLPPFEKPLFGGGRAVRGWKVGSFVGDRLAVASLELRVPFSSPFSTGEAGLKTFFDTGAVFDADQSIQDARFRHGAGLGVFFKPPFADLGVDVAHNLVDTVRVHVVAALTF